LHDELDTFEFRNICTEFKLRWECLFFKAYGMFLNIKLKGENAMFDENRLPKGISYVLKMPSSILKVNIPLQDSSNWNERLLLKTSQSS